MAFLKIDKALGDYYASLDQHNYYDSDGKGKFYKYCVENGFEEEDIDEEFQNQPEDCMYVEFDENFPLNPQIEDDAKRQFEIVHIIKYCYDNGISPIKTQNKAVTATKDVYDIIIKINGKIQKECDEIYTKQCPLLYKGEKVLRRCFSIALQNNRYPFLINLVDSYLRDRALYQYEKNSILEMVKWKKISKYLIKLNKEHKSMIDTITSGVETYLRRGCTSWDYGPAKIVRIQDSISDIVHYILLFSKFVEHLVKKEVKITPFQIDFAIAVRKVTPMGLITNDEDLSDDSEGDSDAVDEKEFNTDLIGDIEKKLNLTKLLFYSYEMKENVQDTARALRNMKTAFTEFKHKLVSKKHDKYPHRKRFCVFIDRRDAFREDNNDRITIYEAPINCSNIPVSHVPEWYFNASKTCIIPATNNKEIIKADAQLNGQLMTISFQMEASDVIKVYIYWMSRYTRIYPQDIQHIFPDIFDMNYFNNKQWDIQQQDAVLKQMQFMDREFETFYHQVSYKPKQNDVFPKRYQ